MLSSLRKILDDPPEPMLARSKSVSSIGVVQGYIGSGASIDGLSAA